MSEALMGALMNLAENKHPIIRSVILDFYRSQSPTTLHGRRQRVLPKKEASLRGALEQLQRKKQVEEKALRIVNQLETLGWTKSDPKIKLRINNLGNGSVFYKLLDLWIGGVLEKELAAAVNNDSKGEGELDGAATAPITN